MRQKGKSRIGLWAVVLLSFLAACAAAYFLFFAAEKKPEERHAAVPSDTGTPTGRQLPEAPLPDHAEPSTFEGRAAPQEPPEVFPVEKPEAPAVEYEDDDCGRVEQEIRDFFDYLNEKDYISRLKGELDAWSRFTRAVAKLSQKPPVPAGEGLDPTLMIRNIYYLYRALDDREILLIKEVIQHEADTLELNINTIYKWITLQDHCRDPEGIRPSREVLYRYAGFFMNTIGGRAYLFRRSPSLRLLISYYSVLILHQADLAGTNSYGIDVLPMVRQVRNEMRDRQEYYFLDTYLDTLNSIEGYYAQRRG
jgi:hypothetical protein